MVGSIAILPDSIHFMYSTFLSLLMDTPGNIQPESNPELQNNPPQPPAETPTESVASVVSEVIAPEAPSADPLAEVAAPVPPVVPPAPVVEEVVMPTITPIPPIEKTIPTFTPHPAHSALRAVIMTCTFLLVVVGGWYAWSHQEKVKAMIDDIVTEYMSPTQPIPEVVMSSEVSGEVKVSEEKPFDFSTAPKFDTKQLVATE
jgi:hypothetical protein